MPKFTIIAHLTSCIIAQDISARAVTEYLSNRADASRYTVTAENVGDREFFSMNGTDWLETDQPVSAEQTREVA